MVVDGKMIWILLQEGGYINPLLAKWYSHNAGWTYAIFLALILFLSFLIYAIALGNSGHPSNGGNSRFLTQYKPVFKSSPKPDIYPYIVSLVIGVIYALGLGLIQTNPNILVIDGTLQHLKATEFIKVVSFLYRYAILGIFILVANFGSAIRALPLTFKKK